MRKFLLLILSFVFSVQFSIAQQIAIGSWANHLAWSHASDVYEVGNKIYCATKYGLFYFDKDDRSINIISKVDGLSEVQIKAMNYDPLNDALIIAYDNTNVDIIKKGKIINVPDIKNKEIIGNKVVNGVSVHNGFAYINCGFGTVVYDIAREEIRDTYYLGANGANLSIYEIAVLNNQIYAATDSGILSGDANDPNLANYLNWIKHGAAQNAPKGIAASVVAFSGKLYSIINYEGVKQLDGNQWSTFPVPLDDIRKLRANTNRFFVVSQNKFIGYNSDLQIVNSFENPGGVTSTRYPVCDKDNKIWVADYLSGLLELENNIIKTKIFPQGPYDAIGENDLNIKDITFTNQRLLALPLAVAEDLGTNFVAGGFHEYKDGFWKNYPARVKVNGEYTLPYNYAVSAINPVNNRIFIGSFGLGLYEFEDTIVVNRFDTSNSTIQEAYGNPGSMRVYGLAFDSKNNLWVSNFWAPRPMSVMRPNGQWKSFEFPGVFIDNNLTYVGNITIDRNDQVWVVMPGQPEILVFKENANGTVTYKKLAKGTGKGNLPEKCNKVYCITEDIDGKMWVGTDHGVVYYFPENILEAGADIDAQPVKVIDGEFVQLLLENENILSIAIDGGDRKWMGTRRGAWLFSPDGTKQINYFNKDNSPLLSDVVNDIEIDPLSGEVFFATDKGLVSYRGTATEGGKTNAKEIKVFPNPVRENYAGLIAIKGLVRNANVKITDINGNVVYQTVAEGGQATWDGKNFKGEKVSTGVYLAYCTDEEGTSTTIEKILFIH
jgi:hypothetical protein